MARLEMRLRRGGDDGCAPNSVAWSARGVLQRGGPCLAVLSLDFWLKIFKESKGRWEEYVDLSKALWDRLRSHAWEDVKADTSGLKGPEKQVADIAARAEIMSFSALTWCKSPPFLLITASRSGTLVFWKIDLLKRPRAVIITLHHTDHGEIQFMRVHSIAEKSFLLFLGCTDGRLSAMTVIYGEENVLDVINLGCVLDKPDRIRIRTMMVVRDEFTCSRRLQLIVIKEHQAVMITAEFGNGNVAVKHKQVVTLPERIMAIEKMVGKDEHEHIVLSVEQGDVYEVACNGDGLAVAKIDGLSSSKYYKTLGGRTSSRGMLLITTQNVCAPYDHLVLREPGQIVFQTMQDFPHLSEYLLKMVEPKIPALVDSLEMLRLLSSSEVNLQRVYNMIQALAASTSTAKWKLAVYLCQVHLAMRKRDESQRSVEDLCQRLRVSLLCRHVVGSKHSQHIVGYLRKFKDGDEPKGKPEAPGVKNTGLPKCFFCGKALDYDGGLKVKCENNHTWPLCTKTLAVCDSHLLRRCVWCDAMALASETDDGDDECTFCNGPLVTS